MEPATTYNPDRHMADLRHVLASGRKRIGLLLGAGAPMSMSVPGDDNGSGDRSPLIPDIDTLTSIVIESLSVDDRRTVDQLTSDIDGQTNIEVVLTRVRQLGLAIGDSSVYGLNGPQYQALADRICSEIGRRVAASLPQGANPYSHLVHWISGTQRDESVEIFTPNYDLLMEEALERDRVPYFDGFVGSHRSFFNPASVVSDRLPPRWSLLWKLHGSIGWRPYSGTVIRTGDRKDTTLIYPDHLKYDHIGRLPFSAFFERLRTFLTTADTLLICCGFSFRDSHLCSAIVESLSANKHTAVLAFQYKDLAEETNAVQCAEICPNLAIYAKNGAVMNGVSGSWELGQPQSTDWANVRRMFWNNEDREFTLGDFSHLARFLAFTASPAGSGLSAEHTPDEAGAQSSDGG